MADEQRGKKKRVVRRRDGVRFFREPAVTLYRMGRAVATYRGAFCRLDVSGARVEFRDATVRVGEAALSAKAMTLDVGATRLVADRGVRIEERGVTLVGERAVALPSLNRLAFEGRVRVHARDREAAAALLASRDL